MARTRPPATVAAQLLEAHGLKRPPIDVEAIARSQGIAVVFKPFDGNISGVLYRRPEGSTIGINSRQSATRQRFSVAHELGHFFLHSGEMYLDKVRVNFRDQRASMGTSLDEIDANDFAAELLMPRDQVGRLVLRWRNHESELDDREFVQSLAKEFAVSPEAMGYRLANLGFRPQF